MNRKRCLFLLTVFIGISIFVLPDYGECRPGDREKDKSYYKQEGLKHFKKGFYELTPRGKKDEAVKHYQLAVQAFKQALDIREDKEIRRNLAKIYYVQEKYAMAASEYEKASKLDPYDIENYVELALSYMYLERYNEAIQTLETARAWTVDEDIIERLDSYIETARNVKDGKEGPGNGF
ncbi:MAG: hypothetical protein R6U50_02710 [Desulfobacterales bacterium]